jgi:hypothetical protein
MMACIFARFTALLKQLIKLVREFDKWHASAG